MDENDDDACGAGENCPSKDALQIAEANEDGSFDVIRHRENHTLEYGSICQPKQAKNLIKVKKECEEGWHTIQNEFEIEGSESSGPAMVNNQAYKDGWTNIFGKVDIGDA